MILLDKMVAVISTLLAIVVILFTFLLTKLEKKRRKFDKLGGPKSLPIVGNVHQMKRSPRGMSDSVIQWQKPKGVTIATYC